MNISKFIRTILLFGHIGLLLVAQVSAADMKPANGKTITVGVTGSMYANIRNGNPLGAIVEGTDHVLRKMGYQPRYIVMSASDIKKGIKKGELSVGVGLLIRTKKPNVDYSGSFVREYNVLLRKRGTKSKIDSLNDLVGKRIGARKGFVYPLLDKRNDITLIRHRKDGENVRKLFLDDLDVVVVGSVSDIYEFRSEGVMSDLELIDSAVGYIDLGVGFSRAKFSDSEIARFNQTQKTFLSSNAWQAILDKNGILDLVKKWNIMGK